MTEKMTGPKFVVKILLQNKYGTELRTEFRFCPTRRFRADYYIPSLNVLVEYEGIYSATSRHTNLSGYALDCEKYNLAQLLGYRVLRYTAKNYRQLMSDLERLEEDLKVGGTDD